MKIGIFDSGIGGLTVLMRLKQNLPNADLTYFADNVNLPYGDKSRENIIKFTTNIIRFFIKNEIDIIVVPCNTSSAIAIDDVRQRFPKVKIFDIISPIASKIANNFNHLAVIATEGTIKSNIYRQKFQQNNPKITIEQIACPKLVPMIENNLTDNLEKEKILELYLSNVITNKSIEGLIYGCTHYQYLNVEIKNILAKNNREIQIFHPDDFLLQNILQNIEIDNINNQNVKFYTTGDKMQFFNNAKKFFDFIELNKIMELKNFH